MSVVEQAMTPNPDDAKVDVPTDSKASLTLPPGAKPSKWQKNGTDWEGAPEDPGPALVDSTPGNDDVYTVWDDNAKNSLGAVVRWKPDPPASVELKPGRGNASVSWPALAAADETNVDYYKVDLDPRPPVAQLPRKVKQGAVIRKGAHTLSLTGLPPGFYTACISANRERDRGMVSSEVKTSPKVEVWPPTGRRRSVLRTIGRVALCVVPVVVALCLLLFVNPDWNFFNGWALTIAALVTVSLVALIYIFVPIRDLLTGPDNRISTSRVNVAMWSVAIAFGILTLAVVSFGAPNQYQKYQKENPCGLTPPPASDDPKHVGLCLNGRPFGPGELSFADTFKDGLVPNYLVLLGGPFVTLAGSAFIVNRQIDNGDRQKVQSLGPSSFVDSLTNDDGSADLVDCQYLVFSGVLFFYFMTSFIPNPYILPELPWGLVGLTGVSAGTYLLNKSVTTNGLSVQELAPNPVKQGGSVRVLGLNFLPEGSAGLANGGVAVFLNELTPPVTKVSNTEVIFSTADVPEANYNVRLVTAANVSAPAGSLKVLKGP